ncbi:LysR family transcriptional regulator [Salinicoccus sediminis]|nr:LysR family transcriptional regulator [Salinicoccus sediminis]
MMELKDLRIFKSVAAEGSISRAAAELNFVQSYITTRMKALEAELDAELLLRTARGTVLSPDGEKLLKHADGILARVDALHEDFDDGSQKGSVTVGTVETITRLPEILTAYQLCNPEVNISVYTDVTKNITRQIMSRDIDCAFVADFTDHPNINKMEILRERLVLISNAPEITMADLKQKPMLVFKKGCSYRAKLEEWLLDAGIEKTKVKEFGTMETILGSVRAGLGISLVPEASVSELIETGALYSYDIPKHYNDISTDFIWPRDSGKRGMLERFAETVRKFKDA